MSKHTATHTKSTRAIQILIITQVLVAATFFAVFSLGQMDPQMLRTIFAIFVTYSVLAVASLVFLNKRNVLGLRACLVIAIIASLPGKAIIGIILSSIAFGLTFKKSNREFFALRS